jgi:glutathione S-transferase
MMKLFYAPGACSLAAHIALEETGVAFEAVRLNLMEGDQRKPDYLALNPKGRVPALATPQGVLTESPAILLHLCALYPQAGLAPEEPWARAQVMAFVIWCSGTVHGAAFASAFRQARFSTDETTHPAIRAAGIDNARQHLAEIEAQLGGRDWMFDAFSIADFYPLIFRRWAARLGIDITPFAGLKALSERVAARPAAARAIAREGIKLDA